MANIKLIPLNNNAATLKPNSSHTAYNVCAGEDIAIKPGRQNINLGFCLDVPQNVEAVISQCPDSLKLGLAGSRTSSFDKKEYFDCDVMATTIRCRNEYACSVCFYNKTSHTIFVQKGSVIAELSFRHIIPTEQIFLVTHGRSA